jgi:hypothetical protein
MTPIGISSETAKLNRMDPQAWLTDALSRITDHKIKRIVEGHGSDHRRKSYDPSCETDLDQNDVTSA